MGYIVDATTILLFTLQVGLLKNNEDSRYSSIVNNTIEYNIRNRSDNDKKDIVSLTINRLVVNLSKTNSKIITSYIFI